MNDDARDDATNQPISLNNEATPDVTVLMVPLPPPLPQLALAWGGYLLQLEKDDEDFKEVGDFNREREDYMHLYEEES